MTEPAERLCTAFDGEFLLARGPLAAVALAVRARLAEVGSALGKDPLTWLLTGGDDHALAATFPAGSELVAPWQPVGVVEVGAGVTVDGAVSAWWRGK